MNSATLSPKMAQVLPSASSMNSWSFRIKFQSTQESDECSPSISALNCANKPFGNTAESSNASKKTESRFWPSPTAWSPTT